ncbi:unnamed protein product, partial [Mycena citricolor]
GNREAMTQPRATASMPVRGQERWTTISWDLVTYVHYQRHQGKFLLKNYQDEHRITIGVGALQIAESGMLGAAMRATSSYRSV